MTCPVCKNSFTQNDDIVVCPDCGTPHHRACWFSVSHCANEDRHAEGFVFEPDVKKKTADSFFADEPNADIQPEFSSPAEEAAYNEAHGNPAPDFQAPIFGGFGQVGINFGENPTVAGIPIEEAIAFVGDDPNSSKLLFKMVLVDKFKSIRPNLITILFPYLWFFYRKMYKTGFLVIALMLTVTAVFTNANTVKYSYDTAKLEFDRLQGVITEEQYNAKALALAEKGTGNSYYYDVAPQILNLAIRIIFALLANKLYLEHMKKQVMKTREECSSMDEYMAALRIRGGKSVGSAVLSVIFYAAGCFALFAVLFNIYL